MIVRHDWFACAGKTAACRDSLVHESAARCPPPDCRGCDATVTYHYDPTRTGKFSGEETQSILDRLWHEKYRPMAGLCCMVEEADDRSA